MLYTLNLVIVKLICCYIVLYFCRTERRLPKGGRGGLLSEDPETAIVLYNLMTFGRKCRGCNGN